MSLLLSACNLLKLPTTEQSAAPAAAVPATLDEVAVAYVKLVLGLGERDPGYVDAYYGPADWQSQARQSPPELPQIRAQAEALITALEPIATAQEPEEERRLQTLRKRYLRAQLGALSARAAILGGVKATFDEEARALYGVTAPSYTEDDFEPLLRQLDALLPRGPGTLAERYNRYLQRYEVPPQRYEVVFRAAIADAQWVSQGQRPVPLGERVDVALARGKSWSAYNWYQGDYVSRIELNADLPIPLHRFIELAAHEGYPGHHLYNTLLEFGLVRERGWVEFQVYPLFTPQSLIAEGTADFGISLAFPQGQRIKALAKLAKLSGITAKLQELASYDHIVQLARRLTPAGIEAARRYLDGRVSAADTATWLERYTLATPERARQRVGFFDQYRSYVINYSYGEDIVRSYIERSSGNFATDKQRWAAFFDLISTPQVPAYLLPQVE